MFLNIIMKVVGIDLAGKSKNPSGFCFLIESRAQTKLLYSDLEILREIESVKPKCIAIDAPFWLPKVGAWRPCDEKLLKKGYKPLSPILPTMRLLTLRAFHLVRVLKERKYNLIEVFPRATEIILGLSKEPRKNEHEYDALLCALTAKAYLEGRYEDLDGIIIPK
jgi:predicted nuclease with RNAse H fold